MKLKFKFQVLPSRQDKKTNLSVCFLGEVTIFFRDLLTFTTETVVLPRRANLVMLDLKELQKPKAASG